MIERGLTTGSDAPIVVVDIGNTSTRVATWHKGEIKTPLCVSTDDEGALGEALTAHVDAAPGHRVASVIVASVVPKALARFRRLLHGKRGLNVLVVGKTVPLPIEVAVEDASALGVDRACAAAAAYDRLQTGDKL